MITLQGYKINWITPFLIMNTLISQETLLIQKIFIEAIQIVKSLQVLKKYLVMLRFIGSENDNLKCKEFENQL